MKQIAWHRIGLRASLLLLAVASIAAASATEASRKIDHEAARRLAAEAFKWNERYVEYDHDDRSFFIVAPMGGEYATAPVTWLAVNPWTGDVWELWTCKRLSTPALRKSQAAIRESFSGAEARQYAKLHAMKPACYGP